LADGYVVILSAILVVFTVRINNFWSIVFDLSFSVVFTLAGDRCLLVGLGLRILRRNAVIIILHTAL
jgi:hypothetical protein